MEFNHVASDSCLHNKMSIKTQDSKLSGGSWLTVPGG